MWLAIKFTKKCIILYYVQEITYKYFVYNLNTNLSYQI